MAIYVISYTYRSAPVGDVDYYYFRFTAMFGCGVLAYILREKITLTTPYFFILMAESD